MKRHHFPIVFVLIFVLGCGSGGRSEIKGTVTLDGTPLDKGSLQLIPDDGNTVKVPSGAVIINGKYSIPVNPGIPDGIYTVRISSPESVPLPPGASIDIPRTLPQSQSEPVDRIPKEWNTASTHAVEIKKGRNRYDFNVTSK